MELSGTDPVLKNSDVWSCGRSGIRIATSAVGAQVLDNVVGVTLAGAVSGNCDNPSGACGGIDLRSSGSGIDVRGNVVAGTLGAPGSSQGNGILVTRANAAEIVGNVIGRTPGGVTGANLGNGISLSAGSGVEVIGVLVESNVVVASGVAGIFVGGRGDGTTIRGNLLGVTSGGTLAGNGGNGIKVFGSDDHLIEANVVVASGSTGILLQGSTAGDWQSGSTVRDNWVGAYTAAGGAVAYSGNSGVGIRTEGSEAGGMIVGNAVPRTPATASSPPHQTSSSAATAWALRPTGARRTVTAPPASSSPPRHPMS